MHFLDSLLELPLPSAGREENYRIIRELFDIPPELNKEILNNLRENVQASRLVLELYRLETNDLEKIVNFLSGFFKFYNVNSFKDRIYIKDKLFSLSPKLRVNVVQNIFSLLPPFKVQDRENISVLCIEKIDLLTHDFLKKKENNKKGMQILKEITNQSFFKGH